MDLIRIKNTFMRFSTIWSKMQSWIEILVDSILLVDKYERETNMYESIYFCIPSRNLFTHGLYVFIFVNDTLTLKEVLNTLRWYAILTWDRSTGVKQMGHWKIKFYFQLRLVPHALNHFHNRNMKYHKLLMLVLSHFHSFYQRKRSLKIF